MRMRLGELPGLVHINDRQNLMKSSNPLEKTKSISIIIPTLNEAENIGETLAIACRVPGVEVIVVDGGSRDQTVEIAGSFGVKVIDGPSGRARQMNAGASMATGETLLFLHGDTRLPERFDDHVHRIMALPGVVAGAFQLGVDSDLFGLRIMERLVNLRSRRLQLPYGDQAIFLKSDLFREIGGFPDMPFMEDFELIRRLRRRGRIRTAPVSIRTSARRWEKIGIIRATLINYSIPFAYYLGVSPSRLARWYRRERIGF